MTYQHRDPQSRRPAPTQWCCPACRAYNDEDWPSCWSCDEVHDKFNLGVDSL